MFTKQQQKGLSLVELMIGLLVGTIVAGGAISVFTNSMKSSTDNIELTRLNQDMRAMMDIMVRDIRRAGYATDDPAIDAAALLLNPFLDSATGGATTDIAVYDGGSCIVYSYNRNIDHPPVVDSSERLGFRLINNNLQMRTGGAVTNENCTDGSWQSITEPAVEITALAFAVAESELSATKMLNGAGDGNVNGFCDEGEACNACDTDDKCLYIRTVAISLTGRLKAAPTVFQTITEQVRVRNDKYLASAP